MDKITLTHQYTIEDYFTFLFSLTLENFQGFQIFAYLKLP